MAPNANETLRRRMRPRADAPPTAPTTTTTTTTTTTRRPRARRRWATSTVACVVGAAVAAARLPAAVLVDAAAAAYADGVTYCWQVGGSAYASDFNASVAVARAQQDECALALALQLSKDAFVVGEAVEASWTATLRRDAGSGAIAANRFGVEQLFVAQDRLSQKPYEILFSRVESCVAGAADCDPVTGHTDLIASVPNRPANFTSAGLALFSTDRIAFTSAGNVTLVAHLILPGGENAEQARLDFAFFKTISVSERPTLSPVRNESGSSQSEKSGSEPKQGKGLSTEVIGIMFVCGMVAVALVAVGFVMIRKNKAELLPPPTVQKRADGRSTRNASTTDLDDEFAMLSNEERFMQSQRVSKKGNGFLTATTRAPQPSMLEESRAAAKAKAEAPLPYVGQASTRGGSNPRHANQPHQQHHPGDADLASDDHIVDPSNPASMRHHGLYMEMPAPPPSRRAGPSQIYFNDIGDDEIIGHQHPANQSRRGPGMMEASMASSMASTANPFVTGREPRLGVADRLGSPLGGGIPGEAGDWRVSTELTFDDLRPSADLGPALTLDDLLESKQQKKHGAKSDSISEE